MLSSSTSTSNHAARCRLCDAELQLLFPEWESRNISIMCDACADLDRVRVTEEREANRRRVILTASKVPEVYHDLTLRPGANQVKLLMKDSVVPSTDKRFTWVTAETKMALDRLIGFVDDPALTFYLTGPSGSGKSRFAGAWLVDQYRAKQRIKWLSVSGAILVQKLELDNPARQALEQELVNLSEPDVIVIDNWPSTCPRGLRETLENLCVLREENKRKTLITTVDASLLRKHPFNTVEAALKLLKFGR